MNKPKPKKNWIRFDAVRRGFSRLTKEELPRFDRDITAYQGAFTFLVTKQGMTFDEARAWMERDFAWGWGSVIMEAIDRFFADPQNAEFIGKREEEEAKSTEMLKAELRAYKAAKLKMPAWSRSAFITGLLRTPVWFKPEEIDTPSNPGDKQ